MSGNALIRLRRDVAADWTASNPILALAEPGYEDDTGKIKYGDGTTAWNTLPYFTGGGTTTIAWGAITGTLSAQTDLQNALNAKAKLSGGNTFTGNQSVTGNIVATGTITLADEVYAAAWNGKLEAPTKNAVYDKIQTLASTSDLAGYATDAELTAGLATKANVSHTHVIADVTGLQGALDSKVDDSELGAYATDAELAAAVANYIPLTQKGAANGVATLDSGSKVPASQLPSYVDDVLEFANLAAFPATGEVGKIYVALDTGKTYRWTGSAYTEISASNTAAWGAITGTLSAQTDLQTALNGKAPLVHTHVIADTTGLQAALDAKVDDSEMAAMATDAELAAGLALKANLAGGNSFTGNQGVTGNVSITGICDISDELTVTADIFVQDIELNGENPKITFYDLDIIQGEIQGYNGNFSVFSYGTLQLTSAGVGGITTSGKLITEASAAARAGVSIPHGTAPTSPVNGDLWSTTAGFYGRVNGATVGPFGTGSGASDPLKVSKTGDTMTGDLTFFKAGGGGRIHFTDSVGATNADIISNGVGDITVWANEFQILPFSGLSTNIYIDGAAEFTGDIIVPDEVYGTGWNGSMEVPTKNALWDKIETLGAGGGAMDSFRVEAVGTGATQNITIPTGYAANTVLVFVNGVAQKATTDYTVSGTTLTGVFDNLAAILIVPYGGAAGVKGDTGDTGTPGTPGTPGTNGTNGKTVLNGAAPPSGGVGADGDFYIDTAGDDIYGPKAAGAWGAPTSLVGPQGDPGIQGIPGPAGPSGVIGMQFIIDGAGAPITTGIKGDIQIPFSGTIVGWTLLGDQSGSIVVDIWKDTYANYPPLVADTITAAAKPTISGALKNTAASVPTWISTVAADDIFRINVDSVATMQRCTLVLKVQRN
jgi:hypothetical protein